MMQHLSLCSPEFSTLRKANHIYVDKTDLICELAKPEAGRWFFLARPPRFGKTLLISAFADLFENGLGNFAGLKIAGLWHDRTCSVLRLDFSRLAGAGTAGELLARFDALMADACRRAGLNYERMEGLDVQDRLGLLLGSRPNSSLAVLIDDYDAPLVAALNDLDAFADLCRGYSAVFSQIKCFQGAVRFFFMTGVLRISLTGLFFGFNNVQDISMKRKYGTLLGFTEEEVETHFSGHLDRAAGILGVSRREVLDVLREHCGEYAFDEAASTDVFAPGAVTAFLHAPENGFKGCGRDPIGMPDALVDFLKRRGAFDSLSPDEEVRLGMAELGPSHELSDMNVHGVLFQTGCLTLKQVFGNFALLGCPNKEARRFLKDAGQ